MTDSEHAVNDEAKVPSGRSQQAKFDVYIGDKYETSFFYIYFFDSVKRGKWQNKKPELYGGVYDFEITQVVYGDLDGDRQEDAFINVDGASNYGASSWNSTYNRYFVYTLTDDKLVLLHSFDSSEIDELYEPFKNQNDDCDTSVVGFRVRNILNSIMTLDLGIRGPICSGPGVVMQVKYDGTRFVLVGRPKKTLAKAK